MHIRHIRIVKTPAGEAPLHIREAWVGLRLPLHPDFPNATSTLTFGVLSGPQNIWMAWLRILLRRAKTETGYIVHAPEAFSRLAEASSDAARWWRENTPHLFRVGATLVFEEGACVQS